MLYLLAYSKTISVSANTFVFTCVAQGISVVTHDGTSKHYKGCLVSFLGDTPASALAGGFKEGVGGAYRCCRTCMIASTELSSTVSCYKHIW